jgi:hypothetical protein
MSSDGIMAPKWARAGCTARIMNAAKIINNAAMVFVRMESISFLM